MTPCIYGTHTPASPPKPTSPWFDTISKFVEVLAHACTALAIVLALIQLRSDAAADQLQREREAEQRRFEIYNEINAQYVDFLKVCVQHSWVDCYDDPLPAEKVREPSTAKEIRVEGATFAALISLLERAYIFYRCVLPEDDPAALEQWQGWQVYAESFARRERFRVQWARLGGEFDRRFQAWMNGLIARAG